MVLDLQRMHHMSCCTIQAAEDNLPPELSTLHVSTCDVYGVSYHTYTIHEAAWGQSRKLDVAWTTEQTLTAVCWNILTAN